MATIAENLQILVDNKADIKEAIERVIAEDNITLRMSAWADLLNTYEDELQDATSNTAFPFRFPITFKPEQTISYYFPFQYPMTFKSAPLITSTSNAPLMTLLYNSGIATNPNEFTYYEAAMCTDLSSIATVDNTTVKTFDEFEYFTYFTTVPDNYFQSWRGLTSLKLPKNCVTIGNNVCKLMDNGGAGRSTWNANKPFVIPDSVTSIGTTCFGFNYSGSLTLSENITAIKNWCFRNFFVKEIIIPDTVTWIGAQCLLGNSNLTTLVLGENLVSIGNYSLSGHNSSGSNLIHLYIPNKVKTIGVIAFSKHYKMQSVDLGTSVQTIQTRAFEGLQNSKMTTIICRAATPPTLQSTAFNGLTNTTLYVPRDSISLYEAATNWTNFTGRIQAIEDMEEA